MKYLCMNCGSEWNATPLLVQCSCGSALWVKTNVTFNKSDIVDTDFTMWRYSKAYPLHRQDIHVTFDETITPLAKAQVGQCPILVKMDSLMPSGSFKDRGAAMVVNYLKLQGITSIAEDSSGNGGSAYAVYAAKAGMTCNVFVPKGTSPSKTVQTRVYGAQCIEIEGSREEVATAARESIDTHNSHYVGHNWHPLFIEGVKSIAYEIWEQCGYRAPDNIVVPVGNGSLLAGAYLGFMELRNSGEIKQIPRLFGVQTMGIQPFVQRFNGEDIRVGSANTLAEGIKIKCSSRLNEIVGFVRESCGGFIPVSEAHIKSAVEVMGKQGFFIEPTSALAFAGVEQLIKREIILSEQTTVGVVTGNGLKAAGVIEKMLFN
ncbi:pyridoxal-phosphate dependent enzyme [Vibrio sp. S4M6]|uniref:threonine synthase n=1 Tax=Vibrio sinus TaxID=2946865 RepID=UPI00202A4CF3|nr:pyridoxal-phosphate dependent enzyme [Vibrio sinus]MCL9780142.1 pyridoxal-phosphate dependent enzyme [Vibrio sinus]